MDTLHFSQQSYFVVLQDKKLLARTDGRHRWKSEDEEGEEDHMELRNFLLNLQRNVLEETIQLP
jgi:hypothetical protein